MGYYSFSAGKLIILIVFSFVDIILKIIADKLVEKSVENVKNS